MSPDAIFWVIFLVLLALVIWWLLSDLTHLGVTEATEGTEEGEPDTKPYTEL